MEKKHVENFKLLDYDGLTFEAKINVVTETTTGFLFWKETKRKVEPRIVKRRLFGEWYFENMKKVPQPLQFELRDMMQGWKTIYGKDKTIADID